MDEKEEEEGSEEVESSGGKEPLTCNTVVNVASLTPTSHHKRRETITKLIMRLPPHGRRGCITFPQEGETIDELINRIPTSEGLYKMHWLLSRKANSTELFEYERELIMAKANSALDRAKNVLTIEQSIEPKDLSFAHSLSSRTAYAIMKREVEKEEQRTIRESKANNNRDKVDHMDAQQEEMGSEKVDSSGKEEDSPLFSDTS